MLGQAGGEDSERLAPSHSRHKGNCAVLLLSWRRGFYQVYLNPIKPAVQGADLAANQAANQKKKKEKRETKRADMAHSIPARRRCREACCQHARGVPLWAAHVQTAGRRFLSCSSAKPSRSPGSKTLRMAPSPPCHPAR